MSDAGRTRKRIKANIQRQRFPDKVRRRAARRRIGGPVDVEAVKERGLRGGSHWLLMGLGELAHRTGKAIGMGSDKIGGAVRKGVRRAAKAASRKPR